jgi:hypothetical protein
LPAAGAAVGRSFVNISITGNARIEQKNTCADPHRKLRVSLSSLWLNKKALPYRVFTCFRVAWSFLIWLAKCAITWAYICAAMCMDVYMQCRGGFDFDVFVSTFTHISKDCLESAAILAMAQSLGAGAFLLHFQSSVFCGRWQRSCCVYVVPRVISKRFPMDLQRIALGSSCESNPKVRVLARRMESAQLWRAPPHGRNATSVYMRATFRTSTYASSRKCSRERKVSASTTVNYGRRAVSSSRGK